MNENNLSLAHISIDPDYAKEWQESCTDFVVLMKDGQPLRDTLYRVGGSGTKDIGGKDYFMLLKYVEAYYPKNIMDMCKGNKNPKHLAGHWCIIDKYGNEKFVNEKQFDSIYLIDNSCIYTTNHKYYNVETNESYSDGSISSSMNSENYLFLENRFDKDETKRGVIKINKKTGIAELIQ